MIQSATNDVFGCLDNVFNFVADKISCGKVEGEKCTESDETQSFLYGVNNSQDTSKKTELRRKDSMISEIDESVFGESAYTQNEMSVDDRDMTSVQSMISQSVQSRNDESLKTKSGTNSLSENTEISKSVHSQQSRSSKSQRGGNNHDQDTKTRKKESMERRKKEWNQHCLTDDLTCTQSEADSVAGDEASMKSSGLSLASTKASVRSRSSRASKSSISSKLSRLSRATKASKASKSSNASKASKASKTSNVSSSSKESIGSKTSTSSKMSKSSSKSTRSKSLAKLERPRGASNTFKQALSTTLANRKNSLMYRENEELDMDGPNESDDDIVIDVVPTEQSSMYIENESDPLNSETLHQELDVEDETQKADGNRLPDISEIAEALNITRAVSNMTNATVVVETVVSQDTSDGETYHSDVVQEILDRELLRKQDAEIATPGLEKVDKNESECKSTSECDSASTCELEKGKDASTQATVITRSDSFTVQQVKEQASRDAFGGIEGEEVQGRSPEDMKRTLEGDMSRAASLEPQETSRNKAAVTLLDQKNTKISSTKKKTKATTLLPIDRSTSAKLKKKMKSTKKRIKNLFNREAVTE